MLNPQHFFLFREFRSTETSCTMPPMHLTQWTAWFLIPDRASAALIQDLPQGCNFTTGKVGAHCIPIFLNHLIQWVLGFVGAFCLINIMIGGYQIALGSAIGDKEAGKGRVLWALIGLFVSIVSYGLINLLISTLGL